MAAENVIEITDDNFEAEVKNSDLPVLLDFWAEWCMPCKMLAPVIDEIATEFAGKIKVGKLDTDSAREAALEFGISAIPTVIIFNKGEVAQRFVGLQQKADLTTAINELLS
ncbi:MAG: thioredoxin [Phycisphaerae bacterium]|jgi:thioredoxin 1|nr:thioredoxin [Phycisphaerae bacterium]MDP7290286.1 thioredoxin [Phycisphaerae bacterium]